MGLLDDFFMAESPVFREKLFERFVKKSEVISCVLNTRMKYDEDNSFMKYSKRSNAQREAYKTGYSEGFMAGYHQCLLGKHYDSIADLKPGSGEDNEDDRGEAAS